MATVTKINPTNLDFDSLKASLKTYLKSQDKFKDYNFEGSGLAVLLDLLAVNTQYNAFLINMLANESFIDSAVMRSNVVSLAKMLNYVPYSARAPIANLRVTVSNVSGNPDTIMIEKGYRFQTTIDGVTYSYIPVNSKTLTRNSSNKYITDLDVYQGVFVSNSYTYDTSSSNTFEISNAGVDLTFLKVYVYPSGIKTGTPIEYSLATDISTINKNTNSYFIKENQSGLYEVYFGDGIISAAPDNGSLISLEYLVTNGSASNLASVFTKSTSIANTNSILISVNSSSSGGSEKEDIDSIRLLAPKFNTTQNRAVTADDFKTIIKKNYPAVESVAVWGGEDADPVSYGEVFVAIKPYNNFTFSNVFKSKIATELKQKYMVMSVRPRIVDPDIISVIVDTKVVYDNINSNKTEDEIKYYVNEAIKTFFDDNLSEFNTTLRYSKLVAAIDNALSEISGNYTILKLKKSITPSLSVPTEYIINFSNKITPGSLSSTGFTIQGTEYKLKDVPVGNVPYTQGDIVIYRTSGSTDIILQSGLGTIDYSTGKVMISSFSPETVADGSNIDIIVTPSTSTSFTDISSIDYNIYTNNREQIIVLDNTSSIVSITGVLNNG